MVYYVKERKLHIGVYEKVYLTENEHYILMKLLNNGVIEKGKNDSLPIAIMRLKRKTGLKIKTLRNYGYTLESEVYLGEDTNE